MTALALRVHISRLMKFNILFSLLLFLSSVPAQALEKLDLNKNLYGTDEEKILWNLVINNPTEEKVPYYITGNQYGVYVKYQVVLKEF